MTFDIVVGNPPYDRTDIQMRFALGAFDIAQKHSLMIIPAKWQCKGDRSKDKLYESFRDRVVPHMSEICFFPDSTDIFDICEASGVSYYMTDRKATYITKKIANKCVVNKNYNDEVERQFLGSSNSLNNKGQVIIDKILKLNSHIFKPSGCAGNTYQYWCNALLSEPCKVIESGAFINCIMSPNTGKLHVLAIGEVNTLEDIKDGLQHDNYNPLFTSNSMIEVVSFMSYAYTKFTRFLIFNSIAGLASTGSAAWWRFVPLQTFDHIFTDEELYKKYNLCEEDISLIESTIQDRPLKTVLSWIPESLVEVYNNEVKIMNNKN